ncbi:glutathione-disulfide reductase [Psychromonas sp. CD1]|uniref:glutathione-disulfide reductase n=1 Tax=Psychromonas sp. CD1 TaxID=1979839 RepID=UPI000B9AB464|nr:glutathione-disulfide reductase [Psychromonas sp. CD1]
MTNHNYDFDYICIGGGSGGIASANRAAMYGKKVAIIEAHALGGTCVNVGCVPKKAMWYAGQIADALRYAPDYGFDAPLQKFSWEKLIESREAYIARIHQSYDRNLANNNVTVIHGFATFIDDHCIEVNGQQLRAPHISIATGGRPIVPSILGAELGITSDGFFALNTQPKRVAVVGAGYIAVEIAGVFNALQSETHLLCRKHTILRSFDSMLSSTLVEIMQTEGPKLHTHSVPKSVTKNADASLTLHLENAQSITVDCIVWAIGRYPATENMGLENTQIKLNKNKFIHVDKYQNTNVSGVYALGDNTDELQLTPVAIKAGRELAERLFNGKVDAHLDTTLVPTVVFSHPPIGTIGLTEQEALTQYGEDNLTIYTSQFTSMYTALTTHRQPTRMKLICAGVDQRVIGLHCIGFASDEILQGFAVAMKMGATKADFDSCIAIHPTSAEELVTLK